MSGPAPPVPGAPRSYALGGAEPRAVRRPASREELAEALREAARDRLAVVPWGGGVALARAGAPPRYDLALDLGGLDRVIEHAPDDLTVTAECGVTLATLRALLDERAQELPLEGARAGRATLGGALAANASGARRHRLGAPRDRVLGAAFALGDGTLARSGGRVVKNVAGYALHRLLCGSRGGLGVVVEACLKLQPAPARRVALLHGAGARELRDAERWRAILALEPAALTVVGPALADALPFALPTGPYAVVVGFEDDEPRVDEQLAAAARVLGEPDARLEDGLARELWQALADVPDRDGPHLEWTGAARSPAALAPLLDGPAAAGVLFHAAAGRLHLFPGPAAESVPAAILAGAGFTLLDATPGAAALAGDAGPPPATGVLALRARLRRALDPHEALAFGPRWERGTT